jgi:hypothetical protein
MGRAKTLTVGKDGFISIGGTNIISELLEGYQNEKKTINSKHFFYILRMPPCGDSRIKIGKSANIYNRFRAYQSHMPSERIEILELREFNNDTNDRFSGKGLRLYAIFENKMKTELKHLSSVESENGNPMVTEWFDAEHEDEILEIYDLVINKSFEELDFQKLERKEPSTRSKNNDDIDYEDPDSDDEAIKEKKGIDRSRLKRNVNR